MAASGCGTPQVKCQVLTSVFSPCLHGAMPGVNHAPRQTWKWMSTSQRWLGYLICWTQEESELERHHFLAVEAVMLSGPRKEGPLSCVESLLLEQHPTLISRLHSISILIASETKNGRAKSTSWSVWQSVFGLQHDARNAPSCFKSSQKPWKHKRRKDDTNIHTEQYHWFQSALCDHWAALYLISTKSRQRHNKERAASDALHFQCNAQIGCLAVTHQLVSVASHFFFVCCGRSRSKARSWQWEKR